MTIRSMGHEGAHAGTWFDLARRLDGMALPEAAALTGSSIRDLSDLRALRRDCAHLMTRERGAACLARAPYPHVAAVIAKAKSATPRQLRMACELSRNELGLTYLNHLADWQILDWALDLGIDRIYSRDSLVSVGRQSFDSRSQARWEPRTPSALHLVTAEAGGALIMWAKSLNEACVTALSRLGSGHACAAVLRPGRTVSTVDAPGEDEVRSIDRTFPAEDRPAPFWPKAEAMSEKIFDNDVEMIRSLLEKPFCDEHIALWAASLLQYGEAASRLRNAPRTVVENAVTSTLIKGPASVLHALQDGKTTLTTSLDASLKTLPVTWGRGSAERDRLVGEAAEEGGPRHGALLKTGCLAGCLLAAERLHDHVPEWVASALLSQDLRQDDPLLIAIAGRRDAAEDRALLKRCLDGARRDREWLDVIPKRDTAEANAMGDLIKARGRPQKKRAADRKAFLKRREAVGFEYIGQKGAGQDRMLGFVRASGIAEARHLMAAEGFDPESVERLDWLVPGIDDSFEITARRRTDEDLLDRIAKGLPEPGEPAPWPAPSEQYLRGFALAEAGRSLPADATRWDRRPEWKDPAMLADTFPKEDLAEFLDLQEADVRRLSEVAAEVRRRIAENNRWSFLEELPFRFASGVLRALAAIPPEHQDRILEQASSAGGPPEHLMIVIATALSQDEGKPRKDTTVVRDFLKGAGHGPSAIAASAAELLLPYWDRTIRPDNAEDAMAIFAGALVSPGPRKRGERRREAAVPDAFFIRGRLMAFAGEHRRVPR